MTSSYPGDAADMAAIVPEASPAPAGEASAAPGLRPLDVYLDVADELDGGLTLDDLHPRWVSVAKLAADHLRLAWPPSFDTEMTCRGCEMTAELWRWQVPTCPVCGWEAGR